MRCESLGYNARMAVVVTPKQFAPALRKRLKLGAKAITAAALDAVARGEAEAVRLTAAAGLVDQGAYKLGWKHSKTSTGAELRNDAPHAATIEFGRRPGRPGPPLAPILEWVQRKLVANGEVDASEAEGVAWAIRNAIHRRGTPPRFILRFVYLRIRRVFFPAAIKRQLAAVKAA